MRNNRRSFFTKKGFFWVGTLLAADARFRLLDHDVPLVFQDVQPITMHTKLQGVRERSVDGLILG